MKFQVSSKCTNLKVDLWIKVKVALKDNPHSYVENINTHSCHVYLSHSVELDNQDWADRPGICFLITVS